MRPEHIPQMIEQGHIPDITIANRPGNPEGTNTYLLECMHNRFDVLVRPQDLKDHFGYEDREEFAIHEEIQKIMSQLLRPLKAILDLHPHDPPSPTVETFESVLVLYSLIKDSLSRISTIKSSTAVHIADRLAAMAAQKILDPRSYEIYVKCRELRADSSPPHRRDSV
jgi:hypothetical protein